MDYLVAVLAQSMALAFFGYFTPIPFRKSLGPAIVAGVLGGTLNGWLSYLLQFQESTTVTPLPIDIFVSSAVVGAASGWLWHALHNKTYSAGTRSKTGDVPYERGRTNQLQGTHQGQALDEQAAASAPAPEASGVAIPHPASRAASQPSLAAVAAMTPSDGHWAAALSEYESEERDQGVYARLFAQHNGNELLIKVAYLKERSNALLFLSVSNTGAHQSASTSSAAGDENINNPQRIEPKPDAAGRAEKHTSIESFRELPPNTASVLESERSVPGWVASPEPSGEGESPWTWMFLATIALLLFVMFLAAGLISKATLIDAGSRTDTDTSGNVATRSANTDQAFDKAMVGSDPRGLEALLILRTNFSDDYSAIKSEVGLLRPDGSLPEPAFVKAWTLLNEFLVQNSKSAAFAPDSYLAEMVSAYADLFDMLKASDLRACGALARGESYVFRDRRYSATSNKVFLVSMKALAASKRETVYRQFASAEQYSEKFVTSTAARGLSDRTRSEIAFIESTNWSDSTSCEYISAIFTDLDSMPDTSKAYWFASYLSSD